MMHLELVPVPPVAQLAGVSQHYGKTVALNNITLDIPARCMVGLIGPDGVGKSSLLSPRRLPAHRLDAAGAGQKSLPHLVGV